MTTAHNFPSGTAVPTGGNPGKSVRGKERYVRKPKQPVDDESTSDTAQFFGEEFESDDFSDDSDDESSSRDPRQRKRPARQRVELRNEQQTLRRQLSDWDDYEQDDFDTKLD